MTQQEWMQILSLYQELNWMDWVTFIVSVVSPLIMVISVIVAWKATKIAKESTELNLKMYKEQKDDFKKTLQPIFDVVNFSVNSDALLFTLKNVNAHPIVIRNFGFTESLDSIETIKVDNHNIKFRVLGERDKDYFKIWLHYDTLDGNYHKLELTLRIIDNRLVIQR